MIAAINANPPITPPIMGPMGVELLDCGVGVGIGVGIGIGVEFGRGDEVVVDAEAEVEDDVEDEIEVGCDLVELESTGVLVVDCAAPPYFVSARPTCPEYVVGTGIMESNEVLSHQTASTPSPMKVPKLQ